MSCFDRKKFLLRLLSLSVAAAVVVVIVLLRTPCILRNLTQIPCPTCGMSRAWLAFFQMDISGAFRYHPAFWTVGVLGALLLLEDLLKPRVCQWIFGLTLACFLGCYALRLVAFLSGHVVF